YAGFTLMFRSIFVRATDVDNRPSPHGVIPSEGARIPHDLWANLVCNALGALALLPDELALFRLHASNTGRHEGVDNTPRLIKRSLGLQTEEAAYRARSSAGR